MIQKIKDECDCKPIFSESGVQSGTYKCCLDGVNGQEGSGGGVALCQGAGLTCMEVGAPDTRHLVG